MESENEVVDLAMMGSNMTEYDVVTGNDIDQDSNDMNRTAMRL